MAKAVTKGDQHELRLARLLFAEGCFVRRAIDLNMRFGEGLTVTDLDVLALRFDADLRVSMAIGEVKAGQGKKGPKLADRLLWLTGLRTLVDADSAFVAPLKGSSDRVRGLAKGLAISVIDEHDLAHREAIVGLGDHAPWGPYDPRLVIRQRETYDSVKVNKDLKRVYWFIRSEFWLLEPILGIKRAFGAMRVLAREWDQGQAEARRAAIQWLARQLQVNIVVGLVRLAGRSYREEPGRSTESLVRELASGPGLDYETLRDISGKVDRYVIALLNDLDADPGKQAGALGAFSPEPPPYTESLVEVIQRIATEPEAAAHLPRFVDRQLAALELQEGLGELPWRDDLTPECERLLRLVGAFIVGQLKIPHEVLGEVLMAPDITSTDEPPEMQGSDEASRPKGDGTAPNTPLFDEHGASLKLG